MLNTDSSFLPKQCLAEHELPWIWSPEHGIRKCLKGISRESLSHSLTHRCRGAYIRYDAREEAGSDGRSGSERYSCTDDEVTTMPGVGCGLPGSLSGPTPAPDLQKRSPDELSGRLEPHQSQTRPIKQMEPRRHGHIIHPPTAACLLPT